MSWRQNLLGYEENIGVVCIFVWWLSVVFCRGHILPRGEQVCLLSTLSRGTNITERRTCMFVFRLRLVTKITKANYQILGVMEVLKS